MFKLEHVFVVFLLSGILKIFLIRYGIFLPIDLTILTALPLIASIFYNIATTGTINYASGTKKAFIYLVFLLFWILFSYYYTTSQVWVNTKTQQYITVMIAFAFPIMYKDFDREAFFKTFVFLTTITAIIYLPLFQESYRTYISTWVADVIYMSYLQIGYILAAGIIINYFMKLNFIIKFPLFLVMFSVLAITGARGPLIFLVLIFIIYILFNIFFKDKSKKVLSRMFFIAIVGVAIVMNLDITNKYADTLDRSIERLSALTDVQGDNSANSRLEYIEFINSKMDLKHFFQGYGFGSYGMEELGIDDRHYPHNMFLEIYFELGFVGLFIFLLFMLQIIKSLFNDSDKVSIMLFFYFFLNSLKSLSLVDSRIMFAFFAIFLLANLKQKEIYR